MTCYIFECEQLRPPHSSIKTRLPRRAFGDNSKFPPSSLNTRKEKKKEEKLQVDSSTSARASFSSFSTSARYLKYKGQVGGSVRQGLRHTFPLLPNHPTMCENESLYYNLTQSLHALQKLRESRKSIPPAIDDHLAKISDAIILCQCACVDEEACFYNNKANWQTYAHVLDTLLSASTGATNTLLQLFFRKSLYWEHYYRNMMEIIALLQHNLYRILKGFAKEDKRKGIIQIKVESEGPKFRRKFLTLSKLPAWRPRPSLVH